jgi:hypothetical protein
VEILTLLLSVWGAIAPYLAALEPILAVAKPVLDQLAPVLNVVSGPLSFVIVWLVLPFYVLWGFFLAVMSLKRARDAGTLTGVAYAFGTPILLVGYAIDLFVNVTGCTLLFLDPPREGTMTARLKRYALQPGTWRFALTVWFATHFLDRFDPDGYHVAEVYLTATSTLEEGGTTTSAAIAAITKLGARFTEA